MKRRYSSIHEGWWDYSTLENEILEEAARLTINDISALSRPGFEVRMYDTLESFWLAEAFEYIDAWRTSTSDNPVGICGPIGPTEQLPVVAQIVNELELDIRDGHFWGMDEWVVDGKTVSMEHPLSFARADMELCFDRMNPKFALPSEHIHFPSTDYLEEYSGFYDTVRCAVMQGGQGEVKHWAFNDPLRRSGEHQDAPPSVDYYRGLRTRVVDLHPLTIVQNARTSNAGRIDNVPTRAVSVGPVETWKADKVSIWHTGWHDNAFGIRLSALMVSKGIVDTAVPMSLLADHPNVVFNYFRPAIGETEGEMR